MKKTLKKPSDYGQFYFRINEEEKIELENRITSILEIQIQNKKEDELLPKRNKLIIDAINSGLTLIEKKLNKK